MELYRHYWKRYRTPFLIAVGCVFLEAVCDLMQPTLMSRMIDNGIKNGRVGTVLHYGMLMLLITLAGMGFAALRNVLSSRVSRSFGADLRYDVFRRIVSLSKTGTDRFETGSLITRVTNDTGQVMLFVSGMMRVFFKAPVTCAGSIVLAVMLSPRLSIVLFAAVAVVSGLIAVSMKLSYRFFALVQRAIDRVNTVVGEYLMGVRLVKAFGRYGDEEKKFGGANTDLARKSNSSQAVIAVFSPLMSLAVSAGIALILYFGSILFEAGQIEVGRVAAFVNYMTQILTSLLMMTNIFNTFVRTRASTERISEILDSTEDFSGSGAAAEIPSGGIEFRNVTFAYPNGSGLPAVKNLSFSVREGETLAVIGPTGSGKSTLAWLCLRFYDAEKGSVLVGGKDVRDWDCKSLRGTIALAPQKSAIFTGTVFDNIADGRPGASEEEVRAAARLAQADGFIRAMPDGYRSVLGQGGVNLSGGQKQRVCIARALVKNAPVLILDDCTSALDALTEAKVRRGLKAAGGRKTILLITQRVGTALSADRILVLDDGEKAGLGSQEQLMKSCPLYREIYRSQMGEPDGRGKTNA